MNSITRWLIALIVVLFLFVYIQHYLKYATGYRIIQSSLDTININTLYERYPIVISDRIVKHDVLTKTLFKWTYSHSSQGNRPGSSIVHTSRHKYLLLFSPSQNVTMNIIQPKYQSEFSTRQQELQDSAAQYVTIKLKKQQCLILPSHWMYQTNQPYSFIALDDPISIIGHALINLFHLRTRTA